ncbi:MAG: hypothetical protein ABIP12_03925, partial [Terriglobales bacterium]
MAVAISDAAHFRLLAEVRWQVFRNSLRTGFKRVEVLIRALTWISGIAVVSVVALAFALNGYFLFEKRPFITHIQLWVLGLGWQILPLVLEGSQPALDFRELARYPIRFRLFYVMSVAYGLLDPAALACVTWLASLALGIMVGHPWAIPWVLIFFPLFALLNLLFNRVLFGWIRQITATRRRREILVVVGVVSLLVLQILFWMWMPRMEKAEGKAQVFPVIQAIDSYSPMGMTANAVSAPRDHALSALAMLGGGCLLFGFLLYRQLHPMYLGEVESDSAVRHGAIQAEPGWQVPFADSQLSTMVEREVRLFFRESRLWVNQVSIWTFVLIATLAPRFFQQAFGWSGERRGELLYPIAISYSLIVMATLAYNCFWSDAGGYYRWLLSPVRIRRVLVAKNIFFGLAVLVNLLIVTLIVSIGIAIPLSRLLQGVLATVFIALGVVSAGNMLSGWFPKKLKSGSFNTKNASEAATLIGLLVLGA